jgi:hypothetical protein
MPRFGADGSFTATTSGGVFDSSGNPIVSADSGFGGSPLGPAALAQTLFSVPNGTFNLLPPDINQYVSAENPLPYWSAPADESDGVMTAQVIFDTTTNTYALRMTPGTATSGDTLSITTRSAVISDDNLALRQKAIATLEKVGTYAGTTQANLSLTAAYYDHTGTQLSSQAIGTALDNATISSITGFTTAGTAAVGISAAYVDLTFTMTATANVTSGISFDINTILLQTSQGAAGGGFILTQTFTSSGTWTRPTGVEYLVAVIAYGGGGGGASGNSWWGYASQNKGRGSGGGGASRLALVRDVSIGTAASISVGIGAGGAGGAGGTITKTGAGTAELNTAGAGGAAGGATTFGTYFTVNPGGGGSANTGTNVGRGGSAGVATTSIVLGVTDYIGGTGGEGGSTTAGNFFGGTAVNPGTAATQPFSVISYLTQTGTVGAAGGTANAVKTGSGQGTIYTQTPSSAGTGLNYLLGGGGATGGIPSDVLGTVTNGANSNGGPGAGGAGGGFYLATNSGTVIISGTAGAGGSAGENTGAGGGAGGAAQFNTGSSGRHDNARGTTVSGSGGNGGSGLLTVVYIG